MLPSVRIAHLVSLALWGGGLLAISALLWRKPPIPRLAVWLRRARQWALGPAAYLTLLSGIWLLHAEPELLKARYMQVKVLFLGLLIIFDFLVMRATEANFQSRPPSPRWSLLLHGGVALSVAAMVVVSQAKPWV